VWASCVEKTGRLLLPLDPDFDLKAHFKDAIEHYDARRSRSGQSAPTSQIQPALANQINPSSLTSEQKARAVVDNALKAAQQGASEREVRFFPLRRWLICLITSQNPTSTTAITRQDANLDLSGPRFPLDVAYMAEVTTLNLPDQIRRHCRICTKKHCFRCREECRCPIACNGKAHARKDCTYRCDNITCRDGHLALDCPVYCHRCSQGGHTGRSCSGHCPCLSEMHDWKQCKLPCLHASCRGMPCGGDHCVRCGFDHVTYYPSICEVTVATKSQGMNMYGATLRCDRCNDEYPRGKDCGCGLTAVMKIYG
jgi:hypothetical protein